MQPTPQHLPIKNVNFLSISPVKNKNFFLAWTPKTNAVKFLIRFLYSFRSFTSVLRSPIFACLCHGPHGCFRSECCTGGVLMGTVSLHPWPIWPLNAEHEAAQVTSTFFKLFGMIWPGIEHSLLVLVARVQPMVLFNSSTLKTHLW